MQSVNKRGQFPLQRKQIRKIIDNAACPRDRVIISLMAYCGLRREETVSLTKDAIDWENKLIRVIGKGDKGRSVPMPDYVAQEIRWHLKLMPRREQKKPWLFPARLKDGHLCPHQVNRLLAVAGKMARVDNPNPKLKTINPHCLRHSYARFLKQKGLDLIVISQTMGHMDVRTTENHYGLPNYKEVHSKVMSAMA